jgi:hypothetical protein
MMMAMRGSDVLKKPKLPKHIAKKRERLLRNVLADMIGEMAGLTAMPARVLKPYGIGRFLGESLKGASTLKAIKASGQLDVPLTASLKGRAKRSLATHLLGLLRLPQKEFGRVTRLRPVPSHNTLGRYWPESHIIDLTLLPEKKWISHLPKTVPHEFTHARQFKPERAERALMGELADIFERSVEGGYYKYKEDLFECMARRVSDLVVDRGMSFDRAFRKAAREIDDWLLRMEISQGPLYGIGR